MKEEVKKEVKVDEESLTDLPVAEDQLADTKGGGKDHDEWIMIESMSRPTHK